MTMISIVDVFKIDISLREAIEMSRLLAQEIEGKFSPNIVIGINRGGYLPAIEIANRFDVPLSCIKIERRIGMELAFAKCPPALKPFLEIYYELRLVLKEPIVTKAFSAPNYYGKILIVDDMVHTGKTINAAVEHIDDREQRIVRTSALCCVGRAKPDYFVKRGNCKFPWSRTSRHRADFNNYLRSIISDDAQLRGLPFENYDTSS
jgi:hypoxanthine phosphoribosyltransferase